MTGDDLVAALRSEAAARYHDKHPFHRAMHEGALTRAQLQAWVANRFYYQSRIPIKDALIVAKSEDPAFRRAWLRRIGDHDGALEGEGGLSQWLALAEGVGLARDEVRSFTAVLPRAKQACDRYVSFVREGSLVAAVASSLTELFAPDLMAVRITSWERHYPWVDREALGYFRGRVTRARRDGDEALGFVLARATDDATGEACLAAFRTKCEILWTLLDAVAERFGIGAA
jgi:pyrroloquinoline-quinone synthase